MPAIDTRPEPGRVPARPASDRPGPKYRRDALTRGRVSLLPHLDRRTVTLDRPPHGLLPRPAVPLRQPPGALHRARDVALKTQISRVPAEDFGVYGSDRPSPARAPLPDRSRKQR
ncbi:hypothetical protein GCM10010398_69610 [Streptomyces fimbriatus]